MSVCADTARILEGEELEACMRDEFGGQDFQVKKKKGRVRQLVIKFRIKNTGDSEINIWQYMLKLAVNSYPDGWTNGLGTHYAQENTLAAGEECECMAAYTVWGIQQLFRNGRTAAGVPPDLLSDTSDTGGICLCNDILRRP